MIETWPVVSEETILDKYRKKFIKRVYTHPESKKEEDFFIFGEPFWSMILPVTSDGMVVAVRQFRHGVNEVTLELPVGCADFGNEPPELVARRELLEETGFVAEDMRLLNPENPRIFISTGNSYAYGYAFLAIGCKKIGKPHLDINEIIEIELIPLKDWLDISMTKTEDAASIVTTYRALPHLRALR